MSVFDNLAGLLDELRCPIFVKNSRHQWVYGNTAFAEMLGDPDFLGKDDTDLFPQHQVDLFWAEDRRVFDGNESLNEEKIGDSTYALTRKVPITLNDGTTGLVGVIIGTTTQPEHLKDIQKVYEDQIEHSSKVIETLQEKVAEQTSQLNKQLNEVEKARANAVEIAQTDTATGLRNRYGFDSDLSAAIKRSNLSGEPFAMAFLDIDCFKRINERFGHTTGDHVLNIVGQRLRKLPHVTCAARLSGDEFALIFDHEQFNSDAFEDELEATLKTTFGPIKDGKKRINLSASAGVSLFGIDAFSHSEIKQNADMALMVAKRGGPKRTRIFDHQIDEATKRQKLIERCLPEAVASRDLNPVYQGIVCSKTKKVKGVEVLARWDHKILGAISPVEFIKIANEIGLISELDSSIREIAYSEARTWLASGQIEYMSFNVSATDIIAPTFASRILAELKTAAIEPSQVCIEVTETSFIEDLDTAYANLDALSQAGIIIALDDYGTGFSNLRALLELPLDRLKVDRSLIKDLGTNERIPNLLVSVMQLARTLDVDVVAEGIETQVQTDFMVAVGCEFIQGFMFSRPLGLSQMQHFLSDAQAVAA